MKKTNLNFVKRNITSILLTMSVIVSATAATDAMSAPFTMNAFIHEVVTPTAWNPASPCTSLLEGTITGTGINSLLGSVSLEATNCITPPDATHNFFTFDHGKMAFTVLNGEWRGDEVFANFSGLFTPTSYPLIFALTDSVFEITGGTGNFVRAKGEGTLQGYQNIATGDGLIRATGKMSHFKKDKDHDESEKDHKKKDKDSKAGGNGGAEIQLASATPGLDSSMFPSSTNFGPTLGDYYYRDQNAQSFEINALPEAGSLSLLGIGLATLLIIRRRKLANSVR